MFAAAWFAAQLPGPAMCRGCAPIQGSGAGSERFLAPGSRCSTQAVTLDVEDLEEEASPEELMLSYVSGEKNKVPARSGRRTGAGVGTSGSAPHSSLLNSLL